MDRVQLREPANRNC